MFRNYSGKKLYKNLLHIILLFALFLGVGEMNFLQAKQNSPIVRIAEFTEEPWAILRAGPGEDYARIAKLFPGIRLIIEEEKETWAKVRLSKDFSGWVLSSSYQISSSKQPSSPSLLNIKSKSFIDTTIVKIELTEKGAFTVSQWLNPSVLFIKLYNTTSMLKEIVFDPKDKIVEYIDVEQIAEDIVQIRFDIKKQGFQGYDLYYQENNLMLLLRKKDIKRKGAQSLKELKIVIDPGHGGSDTGAIGPTGLKEKDVNLSIALHLKDFLVKCGAKPILTRKEDLDITTPQSPPVDELRARVAVGKKTKGDIFISIHCNSKPDIQEARIAKGTFVYFYHPHSFYLAEELAKAVSEVIYEPKYAAIYRSLHVVRQSYMPAVLTEVTFISNPEKERKLKDDYFRKKIAYGILQGLKRYLNKKQL